MDKKYITFYKKFILQTKTLSDSRMILYVTILLKNNSSYNQ